MMGGTHLHTPQSIFQHMMGQQNTRQEERQWTQMPQVPSLSMPWNVSSLQQPNQFRFTGERPQPNYTTPLHQKRKLDMLDTAESRQTKQFITEEKMAAHFQELHISSNCVSTAEPTPSTSTAFLPTETCNKENNLIDLDMDGSVNDTEQRSSGPRLIVSDEIKRLQQDPILPSSLISKLERPSMALILWEPPNKHLRTLPTPRDTPTPIPSAAEDDNNNTTNNNDSNLNNNNESIPNLNAVLVSEMDAEVLEPMDL